MKSLPPSHSRLPHPPPFSLPKPRLPRLPLGPLLLLSLSLFLLYHSHLTLPSLSSLSLSSSSRDFPPSAASPVSHLLPPDHCLLIGANPNRAALRHDNSRALCLGRDVCVGNVVDGVLYKVGARATTCAVRRSNLRKFPAPAPTAPDPHFSHRLAVEMNSCTDFKHRFVTHAYGKDFRINRVKLVNETVVSAVGEIGNRVKWWTEGVMVLVPEYPYQRNIFHFVNWVGYMALVAKFVRELMDDWRVASHIWDAEGKGIGGVENGVVFVIQGLLNANEWQRSLFAAVIGELVKGFGYKFNIVWLGEQEKEGITCGRNVVSMGVYGDINAWSFGNDTEVIEGGTEVGVEALEFKEAVYRSVGVEPLVIKEERGGIKRLRVPDLVVGYARRMGKEDLKEAVGDNVKDISAERVFTEEDENWFLGMLRVEVEEQGVELKVFTTKNDETFKQQVERVSRLGVMVGIHGANLVNGIFMPSFGGLVEVFPYASWSRCYYAGMNSGLAYWSVLASESVGGFRCDERILECRIDYRNHNVYLGNGDDRELVRRKVREAVAYLKLLHVKYGKDGVGVRLDEGTNRYVIVESS